MYCKAIGCLLLAASPAFGASEFFDLRFEFDQSRSNISADISINFIQAETVTSSITGYFDARVEMQDGLIVNMTPLAAAAFLEPTVTASVDISDGSPNPITTSLTMNNFGLELANFQGFFFFQENALLDPDDEGKGDGSDKLAGGNEIGFGIDADYRPAGTGEFRAEQAGQDAVVASIDFAQQALWTASPSGYIREFLGARRDSTSNIGKTLELELLLFAFASDSNDPVFPGGPGLSYFAQGSIFGTATIIPAPAAATPFALAGLTSGRRRRTDA